MPPNHGSCLKPPVAVIGSAESGVPVLEYLTRMRWYADPVPPQAPACNVVPVPVAVEESVTAPPLAILLPACLRRCHGQVHNGGQGSPSVCLRFLSDPE